MFKFIKNFFKWCDEQDKIQGDNLDDISQEEWTAGIEARNKYWDRLEHEAMQRSIASLRKEETLIVIIQ